MSDKPADSNTVDSCVIFLRVPVAIKQDLERLAKESGRSSMNAFLLPYLNAVRRGDMRMGIEVKNEKLLPERNCTCCGTNGEPKP